MLDSLDILIAFALIFTVVSLLVTIIVQMITSTLNLRGQNLSWAIAETFEAIDPGLEAKTNGLGKKLADHLLKDPLLSDKQIFGLVSRATAVRPDELFDVLHRIATGRKTVLPEIKSSAIRLFASLGLTPQDLATGGTAMDEAKKVMTAFEASLKPLAEGPDKNAITEALNKVSAQMTALATNAAGQVTNAAADAEVRIKQAYAKFESWLKTGQERAQEWFSMHAKLATLIVAVIFALVLQLDTIDIFKTVSTNRGMRDKLVAQTAGVLGQAEKLLGAQKSVLEKALESWKTTLPPATKVAFETPKFEVLADDTRDSFRKRTEEKLGSLLAKDAADVAMKQFDAAVDESAKAALKDESANYKLVKGDLDNTGFALFPSRKGRWNTGWISRRVVIDHGLGMAFSILLLSLGAPFWFNTLKSLASLRSTVAGNISDEDKAEQKQGAGKKPGTPPPTVTTTNRT